LWSKVESLSVLKETLEQRRQFEVRNQVQSGSAHIVSDTQSTQLTQRLWRGYPGKDRGKLAKSHFYEKSLD